MNHHKIFTARSKIFYSNVNHYLFQVNRQEAEFVNRQIHTGGQGGSKTGKLICVLTDPNCLLTEEHGGGSGPYTFLKAQSFKMGQIKLSTSRLAGGATHTQKMVRVVMWVVA